MSVVMIYMLLPPQTAGAETLNHEVEWREWQKWKAQYNSARKRKHNSHS